MKTHRSQNMGLGGSITNTRGLSASLTVVTHLCRAEPSCTTRPRSSGCYGGVTLQVSALESRDRV